jgi:hypothetical protein
MVVVAFMAVTVFGLNPATSEKWHPTASVIDQALIDHPREEPTQIVEQLAGHRWRLDGPRVHDLAENVQISDLGNRCVLEDREQVVFDPLPDRLARALLGQLAVEIVACDAAEGIGANLRLLLPRLFLDLLWVDPLLDEVRPFARGLAGRLPGGLVDRPPRRIYGAGEPRLKM